MVKVKVTGDIVKFRQLVRRLKGYGDAQLQQLNKQLAEETIELIRFGFEVEKDPRDKSWRQTQRGGRILRDTGRLASSWHRKKVSARGFTVSSPVSYASYHQTGTRNRDGSRRMVARRMVPTGTLPDKWLVFYQEAIEDSLEKLFDV